MKVRILYNEHPQESLAREIALELEKEKKYRKKITFTEFDHGAVSKGFKLPSKGEENDKFVDEYLWFITEFGERGLSGYYPESMYIFFREHPEFLRRIDGAEKEQYPKLAYDYVATWKKELTEGILFDYWGRILQYILNRSRKFDCLINLHNGPLQFQDIAEFKEDSAGLVEILPQKNVARVFEEVGSEWDGVTVLDEPGKESFDFVTLVEFFEYVDFPEFLKLKQKFKDFMMYMGSKDVRENILKKSMSYELRMMVANMASFYVYERSKYTDNHLEYMRKVLDRLIVL